MSNPYPPGQCTWWCADDRPWCLAHGNLGNALDWAANWRARGGFVGMTPAAGTIACFQPGVDGADAVFGHVAIVLSVDAVSFTVSEMNGPAGPGRIDNRVCYNSSGVSFLHQSPPTPPPITQEDPKMFVIAGPGNAGEYFLYPDGTLIPLGNPSDVTSANNAGVRTITISDVEAWNAMLAKSARVNAPAPPE